MIQDEENPKLAAAFAEMIKLHEELLRALKVNLPELKELLEENKSSWGYEESVHRFYRQSFKVFKLQSATKHIVEVLQKVMPDRMLDKVFLQIVQEGTGKEFKIEDNKNWLTVTRPIIEAHFHALYFLEMAVKYGEVLESPPQILPFGWAALLGLYGLR